MIIRLRRPSTLWFIGVLLIIEVISVRVKSSTRDELNLHIEISTANDSIEKVDNPRIYNITFDGRTRKYLVYKPENNLNKSPDGLIVACHSFGGKMENMYQYYGIKSVANSLNMIVLAPQALPEEDSKLQNKIKKSKRQLSAVWGQVLYIDASYKVLGIHIPLVKAYFNSKVDDIAFIHDLIKNVQTEYSVNTNNTFIVGSSMGGFMAYAYALKYGNELSGLINIVGSMGLKVDTANINVSLPILDFHSTTDGVVFYNGKGNYASVKNVYMKDAIPKLEVLGYWASKNGICNAPLITTMVSNPNNGVSFKKYYYEHPTKEITHYQLTGTPHSYSLKASNGDPIEYLNEIKSFIQRHMR